MGIAHGAKASQEWLRKGIMETSFIILIEITALSLYGAIPEKMKFSGLAP